MKIVDPGHVYQLACLDGDETESLRFVKRCTPPEKYPGNVGSHAGTTMQEVLRALIDRALYVGGQIPCTETELAVEAMREALWFFEVRAARRHDRALGPRPERIEQEPTCATCGHIRCQAHPEGGPRGSEDAPGRGKRSLE